MPNSAWPPPGWARKPVTTSSKISAVPDASVISAELSQEFDRLEGRMAALHRLDEHGGKLARRAARM